MPLMVTIQPWVIYYLVLNRWSRHFDFNLVCHRTPEKHFFSFLFRKKRPWAGFNFGTPTTNPDHTLALDCLAMAPLLIIWFLGHRGKGEGNDVTYRLPLKLFWMCDLFFIVLCFCVFSLFFFVQILFGFKRAGQLGQTHEAKKLTIRLNISKTVRPKIT